MRRKRCISICVGLNTVLQRSLKRLEEFTHLLDSVHLSESRTIIKLIMQIWTLWEGTWSPMNNYSERRGTSKDYPRQTGRYSHFENLMKSMYPLLRKKKKCVMHALWKFSMHHSAEFRSSFKEPRCICSTFTCCLSTLSYALFFDAGDTTLHKTINFYASGIDILLGNSDNMVGRVLKMVPRIPISWLFKQTL